MGEQGEHVSEQYNMSTLETKKTQNKMETGSKCMTIIKREHLRAINRHLFILFALKTERLKREGNQEKWEERKKNGL